MYVYLFLKGLMLKDLVYKVYIDFGKIFFYVVNVRIKRCVGDDYEF